jgi:hypothetical protein
MPKQLAEPEESAPARPDRAIAKSRKETAQRVEELKLRLVVLVDSHFEHSLRIIRGWMQDERDNTKKKR